MYKQWNLNMKVVNKSLFELNGRLSDYYLELIEEFTDLPVQYQLLPFQIENLHTQTYQDGASWS